MKAVKLGLVIMAVAIVTVGLSGGAYAFHRGGVAECSGCHSMHSPGGARLLVNSDASSTCLSCHMHAGDTGPSSYHVATADADMTGTIAPLQRGPGGDFGWLKKNYAWTAHGEAEAEAGETHGHNIVAADMGYIADSKVQSPGGTFSSSQLGCQSCHDPHGKGRRDNAGNYSNTGAPIYTTGSTGIIPAAGLAVGTYRILAGTYYNPGTTTPFGAWPIAVAPSSYNRTEAATQTRIAYGGGGSTNQWGRWCGTCHGLIANETGLTGHNAHPVDDALGSTIAANYNAYVKSGDMTGTGLTYTSLVPFAEATSAIATLATHAKSDDTYLNGPGTSDEVNCLSCHRAHASGWKHALRWNTEASFIVSNGAYPAVADNNGHTPTEAQAAYYDRPPTVFATYQRSLCNKCHAKD